ncbi:hypothetical protein ACMFMG_000772 [Clarireedia jacksonii]
MAPKHGLSTTSSQSSKRAKTDSAVSNSTTPPATSADPVSFSVEYPDMNNKRPSAAERTLQENAEFQASPFIGRDSPPGELDLYYTVTPSDAWASMRKYNNFIIQDNTFKNNDVVFVKGRTESGTEAQDFWVARILQVRAKSSQQVYALVAWMYWPFELPRPAVKDSHLISANSGHRKYHGKSELIASNFLEVLDVLSFAGKVDIQQYNEDIVDGVVPDVPKGFYWRQTFCRGSFRLSALPKHCTCEGHYNPDKPMYICDSESCKTMFHPECLVDDMLTKIYKEEYPETGTELSTNGTTKKKGPKAKRKIYAGKLKGELRDGTPLMIKILNVKQGTEESHRIACPKCHTLFD